MSIKKRLLYAAIVPIILAAIGEVLNHAFNEIHIAFLLGSGVCGLSMVWILAWIPYDVYLSMLGVKKDAST